MGEVCMHRGAGRVRMNLDKKLADHLSTQTLAAPGELPRGLLGADLAGESGCNTNLWVIVLVGHVHSD